ncbi:sigma-54 interaction domain-containing protein [Lutispora thermophila]|uniref:Arginine utilization regulatory protein n=1 Tax=Lutispora thermophila DSM 19022 TaxID=1122184 RepID=A0A1M6BUT9_9FIRM|nr:sigma 54-interacting transcriptional regulator [Lutispora thermophila]SHI52427.1 arginine utilization regulatory protein [Lutispora thermophila DSM 19022]
MIDSLFKENIEEILDHIDDGIHIVDSSGRIIYYNKFAAELDAINPEEAIGRHILEIYPSLTAETSTILQVIKTGTPILNHQQSFRNYRGQVITTLNSTIPIKSGRKIIGAVEISKDITEVKKLSEKVVDLQAELLKEVHTRKKKESGGAVYNFADIIGTSEVMLKLKKDALSVSNSPSPVMVYGETGTGKELLVHAIHNASPRRNKPFIAQNCAAIPDTLLESILFGTVKGSFTGAENRPGLFELANGGTLFLDEVNSMSPNLQAKLLRVLQDSNVRRVGDTKVTHVDVRIMTAIGTDPREALESKSMRADLFYRLSVISLRMPPLRERYEDIPVLVQFFIEKYNKILGKNIKGITQSAMDFFMSYPWHGNVRELEHAIEGAMNMAEGNEITPKALPHYLQDIYVKNKSKMRRSDIKPLTETLNKVESIMIQRAMQKTGGNITRAAEILEIPRQTLQYKISKYGIKI